jgi:hypothetical protein
MQGYFIFKHTCLTHSSGFWLSGEITGETLADFTLVIQYYFQKKDTIDGELRGTRDLRK